jgi:hypothetical protein
MKQNQNQNSTQVTISKPKAPTPEAIEKAKFIDKTYKGWTNTNLRSGNERSTK